MNGELDANESNDLIAKLQKDTSAVGLRDELAWESTIRTGLARDVEALPSFATVPNAQLLSGLATHAMTRGLLSTLGGKAALYLGGVLAVGAVAYLAPKLSSTAPISPSAATPNAVNAPVQLSSPPATRPQVTAKPVQVASAPVARHTREVTKKSTTEPARPMKLDDADDKNVPVKTDKGYQPAVQ